MTAEEGLNLAGVETVLELESGSRSMRAELERCGPRRDRTNRRSRERSAQASTEIVPYGAYERELPR